MLTSDNKQNIVLIGMPGAGKSTVGVVLAKKLGFSFLDSDLVIQEREGKVLHDIISEKVWKAFCRWRKRQMLLSMFQTCHCKLWQCYLWSKAMEHLKQIGKVIYLHYRAKKLAERLGI